MSLSQLLADLAQGQPWSLTTVCLGQVFGTVCLILAACELKHIHITYLEDQQEVGEGPFLSHPH